MMIMLNKYYSSCIDYEYDIENLKNIQCTEYATPWITAFYVRFFIVILLTTSGFFNVKYVFSFCHNMQCHVC